MGSVKASTNGKKKMFNWIGRREKDRRKEKLRIFVATDLHYLSRELTDYGSLFQAMIHQSDGKMTEYEEELLDAFVDQIKKEKPDAVILTGDLTFDGAKLSHQGLREKLRNLRKVGIQVYVFPGNHDTCKKNEAYRFLGNEMYPEEGLTREEFPSFYEDFGYGKAISRDRDSLSYIVQPVEGVRLFFLDVNGSRKYNELTKESLVWLERQLKKARRRGIDCLSFSHQNILVHNEMTSSSFLIENHEEIQRILEKYGVLAHFSGHMHVQNIKREKNIAEIITSSLAISPNQYGVISIENQKLSYEVEQVHVSEWAAKNEIKNLDLLNFTDYAKKFFFDTNFEALLEGVDREEERELIEFFVYVNYAYYCGKMDWDISEDFYKDIDSVDYNDIDSFSERENDKEKGLALGREKYDREKELAFDREKHNRAKNLSSFWIEKEREMITLWKEKDEFIAEYLESILSGMQEEHCKLKKDL